jgi:hypothetical protein
MCVRPSVRQDFGRIDLPLLLVAREAGVDPNPKNPFRKEVPSDRRRIP